MLNIESVAFSYDASKMPNGRVLKEVSFSVMAGQIVAVVGASGCGKTTLLNLVARLLKPDSGNITWSDKKEYRCAYVLQSPSLMPWLSVKENATFGALVGHVLDAEKEKLASRMLDEYGLGNYAGGYPSALSGGMQQRLSVIRAIVAATPVVLLDEPFTGTDPILRRQLYSDILVATQSSRFSAILVSHDPWDIAVMADEALILGGSPATILSRLANPLSLEERVASLRNSPTTLLDFVKDLTIELEAVSR